MKSGLARFHRHVLPPLVAFSTAFVLSQTDLVERIENATLDGRTRLRAVWRPAAPSDHVLLVGIDELSLKDIGRWPWNRAVHGDFLQLVGAVEPTGPTVVGWDLLFPEPAPDDADFVDGLKSSGLDVVVGAERAKPAYGVTPDSESARAARLQPMANVEGDVSRIPGDEAMLLPTGRLAAAADIGFVDTPPGPDGVRREVPLAVRIGGRIYPTLSLQILLRHWHASPEQVRMRLGDAVTVQTPARLWRIPIDEGGRYYVNYRHTIDDYTVVGYKELLDRLRERYLENKPTAVHPVANRILLVGQIADGLSDFGPTPFSALTPLVMVHANIVENVLKEDFVRQVPLAPVCLGGLLVSIAGLALFSDRLLREQVAFALGVPVVYSLVAIGAWIHYSWSLPLVGPLAGFASVQAFMISRRVLAEQRSKEQIKGMFGTYLAPALVDRMVTAGQMPQLGGHEEEITAYFSDIQGYSTFSEKLSPAQLVELLNDYLTVCTDTVQEEGGTLDKYIGDAVVGMFGAPIPLPDHAYRACLAALRVQEQLGVLRERWNRQAARWPEGVLKMQSRIGLNTGPATVGNMGSRTRFNYTMTGDNVNLAARMESGAKRWGVYTMCTEATRLACERHGGDRVIFRPLGRIVVLGRTLPVSIFEAVGLKENVPAGMRECLGLFDAGLARYHAGDWQGAIAHFAQSARIEQNQPGLTPGVKNNPSLAYLEMARHYLETPPPNNWDGVYTMKEK